MLSLVCCNAEENICLPRALFLCKTSGAPMAEPTEAVSAVAERYSCSLKQCDSMGSIGLIIPKA